MTPDQLAGEARILVIALRRLGDVLLTKPLIRSIKRAFPAASIDALVFAGTRGNSGRAIPISQASSPFLRVRARETPWT